MEERLLDQNWNPPRTAIEAIATIRASQELCNAFFAYCAYRLIGDLYDLTDCQLYELIDAAMFRLAGVNGNSPEDDSDSDAPIMASGEETEGVRVYLSPRHFANAVVTTAYRIRVDQTRSPRYRGRVWVPVEDHGRRISEDSVNPEGNISGEYLQVLQRVEQFMIVQEMIITARYWNVLVEDSRERWALAFLTPLRLWLCVPLPTSDAGRSNWLFRARRELETAVLSSDLVRLERMIIGQIFFNGRCADLLTND